MSTAWWNTIQPRIFTPPREVMLSEASCNTLRDCLSIWTSLGLNNSLKHKKFRGKRMSTAWWNTILPYILTKLHNLFSKVNKIKISDHNTPSGTPWSENHKPCPHANPWTLWLERRQGWHENKADHRCQQHDEILLNWEVFHHNNDCDIKRTKKPGGNLFRLFYLARGERKTSKHARISSCVFVPQETP